jgi:hypothetical protein
MLTIFLFTSGWDEGDMIQIIQTNGHQLEMNTHYLGAFTFLSISVACISAFVFFKFVVVIYYEGFCRVGYNTV